MDVKTMFLYGDLDRELYMNHPEDFGILDQDNRVCKLDKSLYGLKQTHRQCGMRLLYAFTMDVDQCLYTKRISEDSPIILM